MLLTEKNKFIESCLLFLSCLLISFTLLHDIICLICRCIPHIYMLDLKLVMLLCHDHVIQQALFGKKMRYLY